MNKFLQGYFDEKGKPAGNPPESPVEPGKTTKRRRGRYRRAEDRPDTSEALRALMEKLSGGKPKLRACARILGTGHSALHGYLNGKRPPPTLDTMAAFIECAHKETGLGMTISFGPDDKVDWSFE